MQATLTKAEIDEFDALCKGIWVRFGAGRAAHVFRVSFGRPDPKISVLMKSQALRPGCKKKMDLRILSRGEVDSLQEAKALVEAEAKRLGWVA